MTLQHRPSLILPIAVLLAMCCPSLFAQDGETTLKSVPIGNFDSQGEVTAGYRFTDIHGYQPQFLQMFDLTKGPRLEDLHISGDMHDKAAGSFADSYWLSANGLGGDPFPTAQFAVHKTGLYDFRVNWRQSYYYWNQNDNAVLPIASSAGVTTGLTDNHNWSTVRKFGSADLTIHASNNLRFNFDTFHTTNDGILLTTRSLDFFNSPTYWGTFARANPYNLYAPLHDETNRVAGGFDYTRHSWTVHYKTGYQSFGEDMTLGNVSTGEVSIDPIAASKSDPLTQLSWSQNRRLTTPISELSFIGNPSAKLEWRGSYIYYRYSGPATLDQSFNGIAPGSAGPLAPYNISQSGRANVVAPNHIASQGFTYRLRTWWDLNADYRYSRFTSQSVGNLESLLNGTTASSGGDDTVWRSGISDLDLNMMFTPLTSLTISPGVQLSKADIEALDNGVIDSVRTLRTKTANPELRFGYKPSSTFSVRGDLHSTTNGSSYTAITPHTQVSGRIVTRFQPVRNVSIEDSMIVSNSKLIDSSYQNNIRSNSTTVSYAWNDRFSIFGGFSYDSFFATGNIIYARGTAPLNDTLRDQEVNRVWQGGFEAKPVRHVGLRFTGNFDRSTGAGQISGEPPAYGPLKWPLATGTVYFDVPKSGRLSLDFQRTYYIEQIVTANNFSANLLTVRWTRSIF